MEREPGTDLSLFLPGEEAQVILDLVVCFQAKQAF